MSAREEILARVRAALADAPAPPEVPRGYRTSAGEGDDGTAVPSHEDVLERFVERVEDYRATVLRCGADDPDALASAVAQALGEPTSWVVLPPDLETALPAGVEARRDDPTEPFPAAELDGAYAVVTAARVGIAETGTIVLDHAPDQGRRALSLVPDRHVCLVRAEQVVPGVPEAVARLDPARPHTWISGPSATSDIELDRVEGVHGPRTLVVVLVG